MNTQILVKSLSRTRGQNDARRVSADVNGEPLWFETHDSEMAPAPEGFASALLVPAMSQGKDLVFEDPLCETWQENARQLIKIFSQWWGWRPITVVSLATKPVAKRATDGRALCFSGGVDSFYSLLTYPSPIDKIVMVHGYDIALRDVAGADYAYQHVKRAAAVKGIEAVMLKTNYRAHSVAGKKFKFAYGGALAAVGHLLDGIGELVISSGYRYDEACPDGSHWRNDPLWSSGTVKMVHYGADLIRDEKLRRIAAAPVLRQHLRVCQQNLSAAFHLSSAAVNCGCCQKCIRTLLVLQQEGVDTDLDLFANKNDLDLHLYQVTHVGDYLFKAYQDIVDRGVSKSCELSIKALLRRSRILKKIEWSGRKGRKIAFSLLKIFDQIERKVCLG